MKEDNLVNIYIGNDNCKLCLLCERGKDKYGDMQEYPKENPHLLGYHFKKGLLWCPANKNHKDFELSKKMMSLLS